MKKGGLTDAGYGGRSRHVARGADMTVGGWRVEGVGKFQVDIVLRRKRRCGADARERLYED